MSASSLTLSLESLLLHILYSPPSHHPLHFSYPALPDLFLCPRDMLPLYLASQLKSLSVILSTYFTKSFPISYSKAHKNCGQISEIEAKVRYVKLARSLKTYGVSFFLVKVGYGSFSLPS